MGYCIEIELRKVKFKKEKWPEIREKLVSWNEDFLKPESDWRRFKSLLRTAEDVFEDIGYSAGEFGDYIEIGEFEREKLGSDEKMFELLAPYLEDCEIVYMGEDGENWKQVIKNGKVTVIDRPRL